MVYLVNYEVPTKGSSKTVADYKGDLIQRGYNRYQAIGSLGGAKRWNTISISNGTVTRN